MNSIEKIDFEDRRKSLLPTLYFCLMFFSIYYFVLIIPKHGIQSKTFLVDNLGGSFIVVGFLLAHHFSKKFENEFFLVLPSFGAVCASVTFLIIKDFYFQVSHLWLSAQIIGIFFGALLATTKWNFILMTINTIVPPLLAYHINYLNVFDIINMQAITYFASLISIYLSHSSFQKKRDLILARDVAVKAEKAKTHFLANMSHEIRTPMNGLLGMLQLLSLSPLSSEQKEQLDVAKNSGENLLDLLNDILDISKIESGKIKLKNENFCLKNCVSEVLKLHQITAERKDLEIQFLYSSTQQFFRGDAGRISQIISNLLSNAIKFTDQGDILLAVDRHAVSSTRSQILISVEDSGIGIDAHDLEQLFDEFSQADSTITRKFGGSGLGLSISRKLAQIMEGEILVESQSNRGSKFVLRIELEHGAEPKLKSDTLAAMGLESTATRCPHKILLVEDNSVNQKLAKFMFKKLGYSCDVASGGQEAIDFVSQSLLAGDQFTLIFMDIQMPEMDGYTTTKKILSIQGAQDLKIVAMTANAYKEDQDRCKEVGMVDFIAKPVKIERLHEVLVSQYCEPLKKSS